MKTKNMIWAALSMTAALVMTACTNDDNMAETSAAPQDEVKTIPYTVTVGQGGDAATTRATVESDMKTLKFAAGDKLYVTGTNISGTLDIQTGTGTASATFSGDLTYTGDGSPASDLSLAAILVGTNNKGVEITDGEINCYQPHDAYCADVNEAVEEYSVLFGTSTYSEKSFTLTQKTAFLNFEITFADGTPENTTLSTVVSNRGSALCTADVKTKKDGEKVVAKFVLPVLDSEISGATVKMGDKAALTINDATLDGKVYNVKRTYAAAAPAATLLSTIASDYTAKDGETLTGTLGSNVKISIADGATVTLKDVNINGSGTWTSGNYAGITCEGDATITLEGTNTVKGFANGYPGIFVSSGKTLVINGTGELNASSNGSYSTGSGGAGIGAGNNMSCGNIEIQSGTVTATGNWGGAGIGGGKDANCGNITISGGTVTATGGQFAAGIGGGKRDFIGGGQCGNITISGGTITATGGENAAGIGGSKGRNNSNPSSCGTITITSGVTSVTATKGSSAEISIGAGSFGTCGTVTIDDPSKVTQN